MLAATGSAHTARMAATVIVTSNQLYKAGHTRWDGRTLTMALIYPLTEGFGQPLEPFHYDDRLSLWVLPFDLNAQVDSKALIGWECLGLPGSHLHNSIERSWHKALG